jgi:hypothetical protein
MLFGTRHFPDWRSCKYNFLLCTNFFPVGGSNYLAEQLVRQHYFWRAKSFDIYSLTAKFSFLEKKISCQYI